MKIREHMKNFWAYIEDFMGKKNKFQLSGNKRSLDTKELKRMIKLLGVTKKLVNRFKNMSKGKEHHHSKASNYYKRVSTIEKSFEQIVKRKWDLEYAYWINKKDSNYNPVEMKAAPIKIDQFLSEMFDSIDSVIVTSATLTVNGKFDFLFEQLGLKKKDVISEIVSAPFDYPKQANFYVPEDALSGKMASYKSKKYNKYTLKYIKKIAEQTDRGIFALFTSHKAMQNVYKMAQEELGDHNLFLQGSKNRNKLLSDFKQQNNSILFGTYSFWEGIDVKGDDLGYVIINKIPFEVPTEPLIKARRDKYKKEGKNFFMNYYLPNAIIKLKQGFGRLIRTQNDHGSVVLLDDRINTKRYGKVIKKSLPDAKFTRKFEDIKETKRKSDKIINFEDKLKAKVG
jgi:ATP-dependent DNA helicase DinG